MKFDKQELEQLIKLPSKHFDKPDDVVAHPELSLTEKTKILESWRIDEMELLVAAEENMQGDGQDGLSAVNNALDKIKT